MTYVLGIDSGGTKYLVKACALDGTLLAEHIGLPASHYRFPRDEVIARVERNLDDCLARFGGERKDCAFLLCGTTGIDSESDREKVTDIYRSLTGFRCPVLCVNDAEVAHFAVTGGVGALVISGTGSIAFGRNARGETARSGGWPFCIFGDDGSGIWIAVQALHHLAMRFDDAVPATPLAEALSSFLGVKRREDLLDICVAIEAHTWTDPGVAAIVDRAAEAGDGYAIGILREASRATFFIGNEVVTHLRLQEEERFRVGAWGSAIVKSPMHFRFFRERFERLYPHVDVRIADIDAATGACRMALRELTDVQADPAID